MRDVCFAIAGARFIQRSNKLGDQLSMDGQCLVNALIVHLDFSFRDPDAISKGHP